MLFAAHGHAEDWHINPCTNIGVMTWGVVVGILVVGAGVVVELVVGLGVLVVVGGVQVEGPHELFVHVHPGSTVLQSALQPSPLMVLPSSHVSLPARLESPHAVLQTCDSASEHLNPHSMLHEVSAVKSTPRTMRSAMAEVASALRYSSTTKTPAMSPLK